MHADLDDDVHDRPAVEQPHARQAPRADDALDHDRPRPPTRPSPPTIGRRRAIRSGPVCRRRARDRPCCGGGAGGIWRTRSRRARRVAGSRESRRAGSPSATKHQIVAAVVDQRPQRVIDRRADDVGARQPDEPAAMPTSKRETELRDDEPRVQSALAGNGPASARSSGMRGEHLPGAGGVWLAVGHVDVVERGHGDKVIPDGRFKGGSDRAAMVTTSARSDRSSNDRRHPPSRRDLGRFIDYPTIATAAIRTGSRRCASPNANGCRPAKTRSSRTLMSSSCSRSGTAASSAASLAIDDRLHNEVAPGQHRRVRILRGRGSASAAGPAAARGGVGAATRSRALRGPLNPSLNESAGLLDRRLRHRPDADDAAQPAGVRRLHRDGWLSQSERSLRVALRPRPRLEPAIVKLAARVQEQASRCRPSAEAPRVRAGDRAPARDLLRRLGAQLGLRPADRRRNSAGWRPSSARSSIRGARSARKSTAGPSPARSPSPISTRR